MLAGDLGRRTGRSDSYPRSSLGVPRQVLTHGTLKLTFRGGQSFGTHLKIIASRHWCVVGTHTTVAAARDSGVGSRVRDFIVNSTLYF